MHFAPPSYGFPALNLEANRLKPVFKTVLIYENFAAGVRAQRFCERLARALDSTLEEQMWNFDVLGIREVRNGAAGAARSADAVILSVSGRTELPGTIRAWLDMWLGLLEGESCAHSALRVIRSTKHCIHSRLPKRHCPPRRDRFFPTPR